MNMKIRKATVNDTDDLVDLTLRLKRLNAEFDPMLKLDKGAEAFAKQFIAKSLKDCVILVAEDAGKVVGFMRSEVRDRGFYSPRKEGLITDFYVMPDHRRKAIGEKMVEECMKQLFKLGAEIITAKFPSQNKFAVNFYEKLGFRSIKSIYAKMPK